MSPDEQTDAEYVEEHREEVANSLIQLFLRYGEGTRRWFAVGIASSIGARGLSLVPPVVLGAAIDAIFRDADVILVVEDGRIVQRGTHDELLVADGLYANLWRVQAGEIDRLPDEFVEQASERVAREGLGSN